MKKCIDVTSNHNIAIVAASIYRRTFLSMCFIASVCVSMAHVRDSRSQCTSASRVIKRLIHRGHVVVACVAFFCTMPCSLQDTEYAVNTRDTKIDVSVNIILVKHAALKTYPHTHTHICAHAKSTAR